MPRIREYTSAVPAGMGLDIPGRRMPIEQPRDALGSGLLNVADTIYDVAQRQEVTDVHTKAAKLRADLTVSLAEEAAKAPAGDSDFASRFNQKVADALSQGGDNIQTMAGRRAWQTASADIAAHFAEKSGLYQAQSAGVKARQDYLSLTDSLRNTLLNDPAQFDDALRFATESLNDPNGLYAKMPAGDREKLLRMTREDMALSAVQGIIRMQPELAKKQLADGAWDQFLDADKKYRLERDTDIAIRARDAEKLRLEHQAERALKKEQEAIEDKFVAKTFGPDGPQLSTKEVIESNLTPAHKLQWIRILESFSTTEKIATKPDLVISLWERIHLPDGDPKKLTDESEVNSYFGKGLTASDVKMLRDEMRGKRSAEGDMEAQLKKGAFDTIKTSLTASDPLIRGIRDPKGDEQYQRFLAVALPEWQRLRAEGKSPQALANPDSPDYIGKLAVPLRRSRAQWMKDLIDNNSLDAIGPMAADAVEKDYKSAAEVTADYKAKKISRQAAEKILREKGWAQ